jgi:hypothetical protein
VPISGFELEASDAGGVYRSDPILAGVLQPGQLYLIGANLARPGGVNLVLGTHDLWRDGEGALTLRDTTGAIVDTVLYGADQTLFDADVAEGKGLRPRHTSRDAQPTSVQRTDDGYDLDMNGRDFFVAPPTPGAPNHAATNLPLRSAFDSGQVGDPVPGMLGSLAPARVIDPTIVDPQGLNQSAIPASPQGGRAAAFFDPASPGNAGCGVRRERRDRAAARRAAEPIAAARLAVGADLRPGPRAAAVPAAVRALARDDVRDRRLIVANHASPQRIVKLVTSEVSSTSATPRWIVTIAANTVSPDSSGIGGIVNEALARPLASSTPRKPGRAGVNDAAVSAS